MINTGYDPFVNGRWVRFFVESTGDAHKLTESDLEGTSIASSKLILPKDYVITHTFYDYNFSHAAAASSYGAIGMVSKGDGDVRSVCTLPTAASYTDGYIYLFVIKK